MIQDSDALRALKVAVEEGSKLLCATRANIPESGNDERLPKYIVSATQDCCESVIFLLEKGRTIPANILLRSVLDLWIRSIYIKVIPDGVNRVILRDLRTRNRMLKNARLHGTSLLPNVNIDQEIERYQGAETAQKKDSGGLRDMVELIDKTPEAVAKVGRPLLPDFLPIFWYLSTHSHISADTLVKYEKEDSSNQALKLSLDSSNQQSMPTAMHTYSLYVEILSYCVGDSIQVFVEKHENIIKNMANPVAVE